MKTSVIFFLRTMSQILPILLWFVTYIHNRRKYEVLIRSESENTFSSIHIHRPPEFYPWILGWENIREKRIVEEVKSTVPLYWKNVLRMRNLLLQKERRGKEERENPKDLELYLRNVIMWLWLECGMDEDGGEREDWKAGTMKSSAHQTKGISVMSWGKGQEQILFSFLFFF